MQFNLIVFVVFVVVVGILVVVGAKKKKWYTVFLANNDVIHVYRKMFDWWLIDISGMLGFHDKDGKIVKISKHWIIKVAEGLFPIPTSKE